MTDKMSHELLLLLEAKSCLTSRLGGFHMYFLILFVVYFYPILGAKAAQNRVKI
jgi:hypothetical protein